MMKKFFALILAASVLAGCQQKSDTIQIGVAGVLSGPDGQLGEKMLEGVRVALDEWNQKGGVLGKKIEIVVRDDEGKPNQAVAVAHELVSDGVAAVIGHLNSGCTIPSSSIYAQNGILQITPCSTSPQVTEQGLRTIFRICGRDDQQGIVSGKFAAKTLGARHVAVLHNKTAYGQGLAEEFWKTFEKHGGEVVSFTGMAGEELDFRANVTTIKSEEVDAVFFGGMYAQGGPLFSQLRQGGVDIPFLTGDGCFEQEMLNAIGKDAQGLFLTFGPDYQTFTAAQPFLKKYRARFGQEGPWSIYGYEAFNVLIEAIRQAGSTDAEKLAAVLRSRTFDTTFGPVSFDDKGDLKKANYVIWTVKDGKFVVAEE